MTPERAAAAGHLTLVLDLGDGWRVWRLAPQDSACPGVLALRSVLGETLPRALSGFRGGLVSRPDGLVAAGYCFAHPYGAPHFQGALPEGPRAHGRRAWIWTSWGDAPAPEAMADLLARARAGLTADVAPVLLSHHARLDLAARTAELLPADRPPESAHLRLTVVALAQAIDAALAATPHPALQGA